MIEKIKTIDHETSRFWKKKAADMLGREGVAMLDRLANTLGLSHQPSV
jgi:hypothetical protein